MSTVQSSPLRVAVTVDLTPGPRAGGHVKCWERLARTALGFPEIDLTVFVSGPEEATAELGANVRFVALPPVFSTRRLSFLIGDIPDHTDLSPWHAGLARRLCDGFDVVHTTDAYFAFSRTAAGVSRRSGLPLVNSVHTATPELTRLFASQVVDRLCGSGRVGRFLTDVVRLPERAEEGKRATLLHYQSGCAYALVSRDDDRARATSVLPADRVRTLRRGIDRTMFTPDRRDRAWLAAEYGVPAEAVVVLFVGRMDPSKNIGQLAEAVRRAADSGAPLHLVCAGEGSQRAKVMGLLGNRAVCPGQIEPDRLGRIYASADLLALPSEIEVLGNVVLEGLASGLPVLVAERSGMGMLVDDGRTGLVVSGPGPEPWTEALTALARDPSRQASMRECVRRMPRTVLPGWDDVLSEDLLPVWRAASRSRP